MIVGINGSPNINFAGGAAAVAAQYAAIAQDAAANAGPATASAIAALSPEQLLPLITALLPALPKQTVVGVAPVATGLPFITLDGYIGIAQ